MDTILFPWDRHETEEYEVLTYSEEKEGLNRSGFFIMKIDELPDNKIEFSTHIGNEFNEESEKASVIVDGSILSPVSSKIILNAHERYGNAEADAQYGPKSVKITATTTKAGEMRKRVNFEGEIIDNTEVFFILRCLNFENSKIHRIKVMSVRAGLLSDLEIRYWGNEKIPFQNSSVECMRISISTLIEPEKRQYLFYTGDNNRRLVKFTLQNQIVQLKKSQV